jgi:hypothetical protein
MELFFSSPNDVNQEEAGINKQFVLVSFIMVERRHPFGYEYKDRII